jgi:hypothetical protein
MITIVPVKEDFQKRLGEFIQALYDHINMYLAPEENPKKVSYEMGTKYVKIVLGNYSGRSVHCFIDFSGNIYKAASWTIPAKHVRGSIYDENFSIGKGVNEYGATPLR